MSGTTDQLGEIRPTERLVQLPHPVLTTCNVSVERFGPNTYLSVYTGQANAHIQLKRSEWVSLRDACGRVLEQMDDVEAGS